MKKGTAHISRREFLWMTAASTVALAQGVSDPKSETSAQRQALRYPIPCAFHRCCRPSRTNSPVIYGGLKHKNYIVETVGCGVAFLDFDNDGWLDIFVLVRYADG